MWELAIGAGLAAAQAGVPATLGMHDLCGPRAERLGAFPSEADLQAVTRAAESQLNDLRANDRLRDAGAIAFTVPASATATPSAATRAAYCSAAGEAMRLGTTGSQAQALIYLHTALRFAATTGDRMLTARTAYRLGLVGVSEPAAAGSRGGGAATARAQPARALEALPVETAPVTDASCTAAAALRLGEADSAEISLLALQCAGAEGTSRDAELDALANLKLVRLAQSRVGMPGVDRTAVLGFARERWALAADAAVRTGGAELLAVIADAGLQLQLHDHPAFARLSNRLAAVAPGSSAALETAARAALARGDRAGARGLILSALRAEAGAALPARLPRLYLLLGEAEPEQRAVHVRAAYAALENLRPRLPRLHPLTEETSFSRYMRDVFTAAVELELSDAAAASGDAARVQRAQAVVESYRQAELESAFGSECLPPRGGDPLRAIEAGETLLYPMLLRDRVELLIVQRDAAGALRFRRVAAGEGVNRAEIGRLVGQVSSALAYNNGAEWRPAARRLYDVLIAPVAADLAPDRPLAIVPDGALRGLPFAALIAPDGRYLAQGARLSIVPALAFLQPGGTQRGAPAMLAASLQRQMTLPEGFFPELTGTTAEVRSAVAELPGAAVLADFDRSQLARALDARPVNILHLATHAAFNGRSDRAFVVANGEVIRLTELRDMIARTRRRGDAIDLIVLSACETAVGDDETSMGLAGAAVQAGASSVVASLWQVNDAGTSELMKAFYRRLAAGEGRAQALQGAQLELLERGGDLADPGIWAGFTLLGAWR